MHRGYVYFISGLLVKTDGRLFILPEQGTV